MLHVFRVVNLDISFMISKDEISYQYSSSAEKCVILYLNIRFFFLINMFGDEYKDLNINNKKL